MNFLKYWSLSGRVTRIQWWRFQIYAMLGFIIVVFAAISIEDDHLRVGFVAAAVAAFLLALFAVAIKRLHDRNKSAWWMIPFFVIPGLFDQFDDRLPNSYPVLALNLAAATLWLWGLVEMGFLKGTTGPNRYGADPLPQAVPPARTRGTPRWDQHRELELIPHSASSASGADLTFASPAPGHSDANVKSKAPLAKNI
jgi:uncharacterized membrane protein YhaH (DUF805 family)